MAKFIRRAFAGEPLQIFGDGRQTRDFVYIDDLVQAIQLATMVDNIGGEIFKSQRPEKPPSLNSSRHCLMYLSLRGSVGLGSNI